MIRLCSTVVAAVLLVLPRTAAPQATAYDPLRVGGKGETVTLDGTVEDQGRDRAIPVRVYVPGVNVPAPVILFSHGLGGSRENSAYLARHWAARGYACVFLQHPGSDESVWRDVRPLQRMRAMQRAASTENFLLRGQDVTVVLDRLEDWNATPGHRLYGRLDLDRVGMSGHSFGAVTTQAVSGQRLPGATSLTDPRIDAAIAMSPSTPRRGNAGAAFGHVRIPWLLMTGTDDVAQIGGADLESRLAVYPALPPGDKYELVLGGAKHSAFSDRALPGEEGGRNPNHHRAIVALSTAFWDAYLRGDVDAKAWLQGSGARSVLESGDRWSHK